MNQFYPTPSTLALKARAKFKNKNIVRLLEPSAGRGDLIESFNSAYRRVDIDCIEIDLDNQAILRDKGYSVIDADFMQFNGAAMYSHIILNPPFSHGCEHVLKAFDLLINGELVAIINAETIRNPYTAQRKHLARLLGDFGSVEFIEQAFTDPDTKRKTNVEIALIWLEKKTDIKQNFTQNLQVDNPGGIGYDERQELAIKGSSISNAVAVFNAAVNALRIAEVANEEAFYYKALLGRPLNQMQQSDIEPEALQERFNKGYDDLKKRAWTNILHSTEFSKYLSSKAYEKLAADFESVSKLSFTELNIRGFLLGLVNGQSDMNMQMLLDCFDEITRYIPENRAYYRGWKSNLKHKEQAYRVQMTRFIMPRCKSYFSGSIDWGALKKLEDFDKTFAMLDGKAECAVSLNGLFSSREQVGRLERGARLSTTYFDVRYYPGVGTIHFFPTNKAVIDRLNRMVGKQRQWLPEDDKQASKTFWQQFDQAEKVTRNMKMPVTPYGSNIYLEDAASKYMDAHLAACEKVGIDTTALLGIEEIA